jgi:hypothetical protein
MIKVGKEYQSIFFSDIKLHVVRVSTKKNLVLAYVCTDDKKKRKAYKMDTFFQYYGEVIA